MTAHAIEEKARFITDAQGKRQEVIIPYEIYKELLELKISQEIYHQPETQAAIKRAKKDIEEGNFRDYADAEALIRDLRHAR